MADDAYDNYRSKGLQIDPNELRKIFYAPDGERVDEMLDYMAKSPYFDHLEEFKLTRE